MKFLTDAQRADNFARRMEAKQRQQARNAQRRVKHNSLTAHMKASGLDIINQSDDIQENFRRRTNYGYAD